MAFRAPNRTASDIEDETHPWRSGAALLPYNDGASDFGGVLGDQCSCGVPLVRFLLRVLVA